VYRMRRVFSLSLMAPRLIGQAVTGILVRTCSEKWHAAR
jgi:hypothetical protein